MRAFLHLLLFVPVLLVAGGCAASTSAGMRTTDAQAIAAVDPGPWHAASGAAVFGTLGQGDLRAAYWWESDPAWRRFLLKPQGPGSQTGR